MSIKRETSVAGVWAVLLVVLVPSYAWADDECPDPELRGGVRGGGGLLGGVGGLVGGTVDATADVAGDVGGAVVGSLPLPGSPDVRRLGEIGLGFEAEGRLDEAWLALHRFKLEAQAEYEADRARIDAAIGRIEPRLGGVIVEADVPGAEVWVRGNLAARLPMENAIFLTPGRARLTVRARGRAAAEIDVDAALGQTLRARAELPEISGSVGSPNVDADLPDAEVSGSGPGLLFWVVGGVAVVGVTVAIGATIVRSNLSADFDAAAELHPPGSPELDSIQGSIDSTAVWQIGGFVVGGLAVAGALAIYFIGSASAEADATLDCPTVAARQPRRPRSSFSLACAPGGLGIGCGGTF